LPTITNEPTAAPTDTSLPAVTTVPTEEPIRFASPTDAQLTREAWNTAVAQRASEDATSVALSPIPPYTPFPFRTESPEPPTPTWTVGFVPCPQPHNTNSPQYFSCWNGVLNGQLIWIQAGNNQNEGAPQGSVLHIGYYDLSQEHLLSEDLYPVPGSGGSVRIVSVDGTRVTLAPWDPATPGPPPTPTTIFVFDLATRQWVNP
jgi:hypothetical protein